MKTSPVARLCGMRCAAEALCSFPLVRERWSGGEGATHPVPGAFWPAARGPLGSRVIASRLSRYRGPTWSRAMWLSSAALLRLLRLVDPGKRGQYYGFRVECIVGRCCCIHQAHGQFHRSLQESGLTNSAEYYDNFLLYQQIGKHAFHAPAIVHVVLPRCRSSSLVKL